MTLELISFARSGVVVLSTYMMHSVVLLGATWLVFAVLRPASWTLRERVWRWMAVLPFVTVCVQLACVDHGPLVTWTFVETQADVANVVSKNRQANSLTSPQSTANDKLQSQLSKKSSTSVSDSDDWSITIVPGPVAEVDGLDALKSDVTEAGVTKATADSTMTTPPAPAHSEYAPSPSSDGSLVAASQHAPIGNGRIRHEKSDSTETVRTPVLTPILDQLVPESSPVESTSVVAHASTANLNGKSVNSEAAVIPTHIPSATSAGLSIAYAALSCVVGWITIGAVSFVLAAVSHRRWCRLAAELHTGAARRIVDSICQRYGIRRSIRLLSADESTDPAAFGFWRWAIVLPIGIESRLDKDQLRAVLTHEVAHLVRDDTRWLFVGGLLHRCFAWQPLNLLAVREWRRASECLCDDWAVERGVTGITLAKCLTQLAEWRLNSAACSAGLAAVGAKSSLRMRVERLLTAKPARDVWQRGWSGVVMVVAFLGIAWLLVHSGPRTSWAKEPSKPPPPPPVESDQSDDQTKAAPSKSPRASAKPVTENSDNPLASDPDSLNAEIKELLRDLDRAMQLLRADDDPEIKQVVDQIRLRLQSIGHNQ
ncbi:MAG: M48 family metalloprotease [Planctomycetota bacterium]|nr:M48 family metalloprotease [Planctomycetota bacterium]